MATPTINEHQAAIDCRSVIFQAKVGTDQIVGSVHIVKENSTRGEDGGKHNERSGRCILFYIR